MTKIGKGTLSGFVATLALSAIMVMKSMMGVMPQLDVIGMLNGMLGASPAVGWLAHFIIGTVMYGAAMVLLADSLRGGPTFSGIILGAAGWLIMMVLLMPMAGQGPFGMNIGIMAPMMTLMLHLIFGAVLGWTYGKLTSHDVSASNSRSAAA